MRGIVSNLARYDGVHFGHRTNEPVKDIIELFSKSRAEGFGDEVQRRIMIGTYALSSGYYDAYYLKALKIRALIKRDFDRGVREVRRDLLARPARRPRSRSAKRAATRCRCTCATCSP